MMKLPDSSFKNERRIGQTTRDTSPTCLTLPRPWIPEDNGNYTYGPVEPVPTNLNCNVTSKHPTLPPRVDLVIAARGSFFVWNEPSRRPATKEKAKEEALGRVLIWAWHVAGIITKYYGVGWRRYEGGTGAQRIGDG
ncbi:hypothetical protein CHU98_g1900 [Xylaria longipes]|nr:hypothetical protein CHU98_g1900 [Xylaria longipes]